jgi:hypothetical protein
MKLSGPDISGFLPRLRTPDQTRFKEKYQSLVEERSPDDFRPSVKTEISLEREHVDLVTAVASGFHQSDDAPGAESGFKFDSTNPLFAHTDIEADILLARTKDFAHLQLCVVACEIGDERIHEWISNINEIYAALQESDHRKQIREQLNAENRQIDEIQYVTLVKAEDFEDVEFDPISSRCEPSEFAIWTCHMNGLAELCHEAGDLIHKDLRETIENCFDYDRAENPIEYTFSTDAVIPLQNTVFRLVRGKSMYEDDDHPLEFNRSTFKRCYIRKLELGTESPEAKAHIEQKVDELIEKGEKIGIFSSSDTKTDRDYRIMFQGGEKATSAENAVEEKYVQAVAEARLKRQAFEEAREPYEEQSDLGQFD